MVARGACLPPADCPRHIRLAHRDVAAQENLLAADLQQQSDTPVSSSKTPTEINNNHKNSDTNRRTPAAASGLDGLARDLGAGLSASRAVAANVVEKASPSGIPCQNP